MEIKGIEGMSVDELNQELQDGARFLQFQFCVSLLIVSFKRPSPVYFVRAGESGFSKGIPYTILSLFLGWWGFPWGIIYTIGSLITNLGGGKDVTNEIKAAFVEAGAADATGTAPLICPQCQLENQAGSSFCTSCGTSVSVACPQCQLKNQVGNSFCTGCGTPL